MPILIDTLDLDIETSQSPIGFATTGTSDWPEWDRFLTLDGEKAYHIGNICGTCSFFFERMPGANRRIDVPSLVATLRDGIASLTKPMLAAVGALLPVSRYRVVLLEFTPRLARPGDARDYFAIEQVANTGVDGFWGLPHYPHVPYYRPADQPVPATGDRHLDFVVPLVPDTFLHPDAITAYQTEIAAGAKPTAVAISVLDRKEGVDETASHACLAHYMIDGHHKMAAAAASGQPIRLLSCIARDHGVSDEQDLAASLASYDRPGG